MPLKAVLFDLDGTLLDTAPDFVTSLNKLLSEENKAILDTDIIRSTVSCGARALIELAFNIDESHGDFEPLKQRLLTLYSQYLADQTLPFDGINQTLEFVDKHNLSWGIVTNKPFVYTQPIIDKISLLLTPNVIICPEHVTHTKPHPESLLLACKQMGSIPAETIYIGDHQRDIEAGKNAGMNTIACAYGYLQTNENINDWKATHIVDSAHRIPDTLKRYLTK